MVRVHSLTHAHTLLTLFLRLAARGRDAGNHSLPHLQYYTLNQINCGCRQGFQIQPITCYSRATG